MIEFAKRVVDQRARRFRREAAAPVGRSKPVPELRSVVVRIESAGADQPVIEHDDKARFAVSLVDRRNELLGVGGAVRMRDASCVRGNAAVVS